MSKRIRGMTGASHPAARRRSGPVRLALLTAIGLVLCQTPASAPAQVTADKPAPCPNGAPDSREACSGRRLDYQAPILSSLQTVSLLPPGRLGMPYPPSRVLYGGTPGYAIDPKSRVPPGLTVTPDGFLEGTPTKAGDNVVMLIVRDSAQPANLVRGIYILKVLEPRPIPAPARPRKPRPRPPAAPPVQPAPVVAPVVAPPPPLVPPGQIAVWSLSQADLTALATPPPAPPEPPPPPPPPAPSPLDLKPAVVGERSPPAVDLTPSKPLFVLSTDQQKRLKVMVNLEYPTLALFKSAVDARLNKSGDAATSATGDVIDLIARRAFKPQYFSLAPRPVLNSVPFCGCVPPSPPADARTTYGFFPFWRPTMVGQTVDFSLFDRIEYLGVQLQADRTWLKPTSRNQTADMWARDMNALAVTAQSHGSHLDLVLQGSDWSFLPAPDDPAHGQFASDGARRAMRQVASEAASGAMTLVDQTKLTGPEPFFQGFLLDWIWHTKPNRVFDGVTVMFQPPVGTDAARASFDQFFDLFINDLASEINKRGKPFALNIVTPYAPDAVTPYNPDLKQAETLFGPGAFSWVKMLSYLHLQTRNQIPQLAPDERHAYPKDSRMTVKILVLLPSPTSPSKKSLRMEIDQVVNNMAKPYNVQGHARVDLTNNIIPIALDPAGAPAVVTAKDLAAGVIPAVGQDPNTDYANEAKSSPPTGLPSDADNLDVDFIYHQQNFGGVGLWSLPINTLDAGIHVNEEVKHVFFSNKSWMGILPVCSTWLRLIWQIFVILVPIGVFVYYYADLSPKDRQRVLAATGISAGLSAVLGFFLLNFDPALNPIKIGNGPFLVTLVVLLVVGYIQYRRPKIKSP